MKSLFIKEQKRYTVEQLSELFLLSHLDTRKILSKLKEYGILKSVKNIPSQKKLDDLLESDIEISEVESTNNLLYVFTYVGVIVISDIVLKCYPKYIKLNPPSELEYKNILNVIEKYKSKEQIVHFYEVSDNSNQVNLLSLLLMLINDYVENGLYTSSQDIFELNGGGEINWEKTINETFTVLRKNRPFYPDVVTKKRISDNYNFFKNLHECILMLCSKKMNDLGLLEIFDIQEINISERSLNDFGNDEYILYRIENELNIEFNTRKQAVLKAMFLFIVEESNMNNSLYVSMFGTNNFNLIWEEVCAKTIGNHLNVQLSNLPINLKEEYNERDTLLSLIERPKWLTEHSIQESTKTLIPDIVNVINTGDVVKLNIYDAKYYNIKFGESEKLSGYPGIESISKQYLYQLSLMNFSKEHEIEIGENTFLFPSDNTEVYFKGYAKLEMMDNLGLEAIKIKLLPANTMYKFYLTNTRVDPSFLL